MKEISSLVNSVRYNRFQLLSLINENVDRINRPLDKFESLESTIYRMNIETYEELVLLTDRYEQSIIGDKNINREPENEPQVVQNRKKKVIPKITF